jgi:predicted nucleic acid-binding protein
VSILVDTGAWYALADTSDRHHVKASHFFLNQAVKANFLTTDLIAAETWTLLNSHLGRPAAVTFWETLRETKIPILAAQPSDLEAAWRIIQAFPDQTFSLVDSVTFALMERIGVTEAFTFDAHFMVYRYGHKRQKAFQCYP